MWVWKQWNLDPIIKFFDKFKVKGRKVKDERKEEEILDTHLG